MLCHEEEWLFDVIYPFAFLFFFSRGDCRYLNIATIISMFFGRRFFIHFSYEGFQDSNQWGWIFFSGSERGEAKRRFGFDCLPSFLLLDFCFVFFCFYFNLLVLGKKAGPALDLTQGIDGCLALSRAGLPYRRGFVSWGKCLISCFIRGNGGVYTIGFVIAG